MFFEILILEVNFEFILLCELTTPTQRLFLHRWISLEAAADPSFFGGGSIKTKIKNEFLKKWASVQESEGRAYQK